MNQQDIRWQQRFSNYKKALIKLKQAVEIMSEKVEHSDEVDESSLPYQFDISISHAITNAELVEHIKRKGVLLYPM